MREHYVYDPADGTTIDETYIYDAAGALESQNVDGDITEFDTATGNVTLYYDSATTEYKTYAWTGTQVTVDVYDGVYVAGPVVTAERTDRFVYDHHDEYTDLDPSTNGDWIMREHYVYDPADGTTIDETYEYDASEVLTRQNVDGDITEFDATGKTTLFYDAVADEYKTWTWESPGAGQVAMTVYDGTYSVSVGDALANDVISTERVESYVYDHGGITNNLNTASNGWIMRDKTIYAAGGVTVLEDYNYYSSGLIQDVTYINSAQNPGGTDTYYEYENFDFYSNGTQGRLIKVENAADEVYKTISFWASGTGDNAKKKEQYADLAENTWVETTWYYDTTYNLSKKLTSTGEAAIFFDAAGAKTQTYWPAGSASPTVSYSTVADVDAGRPLWFWNGANTLEMYTYHATGRMATKDVYTGTWGSWVWDQASTGSWLDQDTDNWIGTLGAAVLAAPAEPTKPAATDVSSMVLGAELIENATGDTVLPENMQDFIDKIDTMQENLSGEGVTIAVIDSGVNADETSANIIGGYDFTDDSVTYEDDMGHGTTTASIISETAQDADILAVKVFDDNGETDSSIVAEAIRYAVDMQAKVLTMSFTLFPVTNTLIDAIDYAADQGAILIAAAGNSSTEILDAALAAQDNVITVGSVDSNGMLSAWSNYGSVVDLYAPWDVIDSEEGEAGTSLSAAFVAGIAAMIMEDAPGITADDVLSELVKLTSGFGITEDLAGEEPEEEHVIRGANVDEVVSMYTAQRTNRSQFSGYSMNADIQNTGIQK